MELSNDLVKQFARITNDNTAQSTESTVYGTVVDYNGSKYVKIDGSDQLTPVESTASTKVGDRVTVSIKDHTATVTGNVSSPAARTEDVENLGTQISEFDIVLATKIEADTAKFEELTADTVTIKERLTATEADIVTLEADNITINEKLTANQASIDNLEVTKLDVEVAEANYATITNLEATNADIHNLQGDYADFKVTTTATLDANDASIKNLEATKLDAESADILYAQIDFANIGEAAIEKLFSDSGIIKDLIVSEGHITGELVGVTIKGDLIEGGTVVADKLVVKGSDGLYYKLNTDGVTTETEQTEYNSLNGSVITAKSITATKISVDDLVAFDATIGGFNITDSAIYSGVKSSVGNTTRGIYLDKTGQIAFGDSSNYLKYYQDTDGTWKLAISAQSIKMGGSSSTVEETINEIKSDVDNIQIGGRNLLLKTKSLAGTTGTTLIDTDGFGYKTLTSSWGGMSWGTAGHTIPAGSLSVGDMFVMSFYAKVSSSAIGMQWRFNYWLGSTVAGATYTPAVKVDSTEWKRYSIPLTVNNVVDEYDAIQVMYQCQTVSDGDSISVKAPKLEKGNKATDWTPAPEDVESDVDSLRDEITTLLRIESSRGTVFKNDSIATVLSAVIYHGTSRITDKAGLVAAFGSGAYLQWSWQRIDDESYGVISSSDSHIGNDGFTFTISPEDVDTKVTFMCELIV